MSDNPSAPDSPRPARSDGDDSGDDVVLLDGHGRPAGRASRISVHTTATALHLAFSCYLFNHRGEVLLTRRALTKRTWAGVWTNSCCGHPRPGEALEDAVRRRVREELGLHIGPLRSLLPDFRYRAVDASGLVENEFCPVFAGFVVDESPTPDPAEVAEWAWVPWTNLVAAVDATPHIYSPWSALQVPLIEAAFPAGPWLDTPGDVDVDAAIHDVDALLTAEMAALNAEWAGHIDGIDLDILPIDLPAWLRARLVGQGKRFRVTMAYWGFVATGGVHGSMAYGQLIRVAAALETLHLFALLHDDVMDESDSRRGRPTAHVEAERWHREASGRGEATTFGRNLAILLGDLAHTVADRLVDGLPAALRRQWYDLSVELIAGQRADLSGAAAGTVDPQRAERVAQIKSGRYTVGRPLQLGAAAAGATEAATTALSRVGDLLGRAFALRDDYLGVWGDPSVTGKPAGDDLLEAKPTVLLALARQRLSGDDAALLDRVGTPDFVRAGVRPLTAAMSRAGVDTALDGLVATCLEDALRCLDDADLVPAGVTGLRTAAHVIAWRNA